MEFAGVAGDVVDFDLQLRPEGLYQPVDGALVAVPRVESLAERMRWHFDHPGPSRKMGQQGHQAVSSMSWDAATEQLLISDAMDKAVDTLLKEMGVEI